MNSEKISFKSLKWFYSFKQWRTLGGAKGGASPPPIIFTKELVLKSGSTQNFSFEEVEPLLKVPLQRKNV